MLNTQRMFFCRYALPITLLLILVTSVKGQTSSTITGTIMDEANAVVPGSEVVLKNQNTKEQRKATTNAEGFYSFSAIQSGYYSIKISKEGFKPVELTGITINAGDKKNFNSQLSVGAISSDAMVVASGGDTVVTDNGERSATLNNKQIQNLSLIGRDVTELLKTLPGMSVWNGGGVGNQVGYDPTLAGFVGAVGNGVAGNGGINRGGTDLTMDGAHIIDPGCNCSSTAMVNADMTAEVKVQTSNFGADSAKGPVVINAISKSGSQAFHGQAYLYARDSLFNSNTWFNNTFNKGAKVDDRYLYPGFNIGGPVKIPGTRFNSEKKLMFWAGFEYYHQRFPGDTISTYVPTAGMRKGDFSLTGEGNAALCDGQAWVPSCNGISGLTDNDGKPILYRAQNGTILTNNVITKGQMDQGGIALMNYIPMPNTDPQSNPNRFNYIKLITGKQDGSIFKTRWDYDWSDKNKLYVNYQNQRQADLVPTHIWWVPTYSVDLPGGGMESQTRSHTISATYVRIFNPTTTNEFIFSSGYLKLPYKLKNAETLSRSANNYPYKGVFKTGSTMMPAISNGYWVPGYPQIDQPDFFTNGEFSFDKMSPSFADNFSKTWGTHTTKLGFFTERSVNNQGAWAFLNGKVFYGTWAASTAAHPEGIGTQNPVANMLLGAVTEYEETNINAASYTSYRNLSWYAQDSWKVLPRLTLELGFRFERSSPWRDDKNKSGYAVWNAEKYNSDITNKRELPGIYWMGMDSSLPNAGVNTRWAYVQPRASFAYDVLGNTNTVVRGGWGAYRWHEAPYSSALETAIGARSYKTPNPMYMSEIDALAGTVSGSLSSGASALAYNDDERPVTYTYNLTISQRLPWKSLFEIAYVGNSSKQLPVNRNINIVPQGALFAAADPNGADTSKYRLYGAYGNNELKVLEHISYANYNALQLNWKKQTGRFTYDLNYTWSKALGMRTDNGFDKINFENNYGVLNIDRSQVFNSSYMYELGTIYKGGGRFLNKFISGALNGWAITGITSLQSGPNMAAVSNSGFNMTVPSSSSTVLNNRTWLGTPDINLQPTVLCNPTSNLKDGYYINGSCFGVPTKGTNGSLSLPYIHGPAYFNSDMTLSKQFKITERQNIQFKITANNWLNHPLTSFNPNSGENLTLRFEKMADNSWKQVNEKFGLADYKLGRRVVQFALKYSF